MRIKQQERGTNFSYATFKDQINSAGMSQMQRLDMLESFMPAPQAVVSRRSKTDSKGNDWTTKVRQRL
jgi:hypothetical protein